MLCSFRQRPAISMFAGIYWMRLIITQFGFLLINGPLSDGVSLFVALIAYRSVVLSWEINPLYFPTKSLSWEIKPLYFPTRSLSWEIKPLYFPTKSLSWEIQPRCCPTQRLDRGVLRAVFTHSSQFAGIQCRSPRVNKGETH